MVSKESLVEDIKKNIAENKIMVYSGTYCPYCDRAKALLTKKGKPFKVIEIDEVEDGEYINEALAEWSGQETIPNIWINGKHIGGNSDLQDLEKAGKLDELLA